MHLLAIMLLFASSAIAETTDSLKFMCFNLWGNYDHMRVNNTLERLAKIAELRGKYGDLPVIGDRSQDVLECSDHSPLIFEFRVAPKQGRKVL